MKRFRYYKFLYVMLAIFFVYSIAYSISEGEAQNDSGMIQDYRSAPHKKSAFQQLSNSVVSCIKGHAFIVSPSGDIEQVWTVKQGVAVPLICTEQMLKDAVK